MSEENTVLSKELGELFDLRKAKTRIEKIQSQEDTEAQRDIRLLTLMFKDGVPDIVVNISETESVKWDARAQKLLYLCDNSTRVLEATSRDIRIKIRPHLTDLVKKAKDFYKDN